MPELPDLVVYVEGILRHLGKGRLAEVRIASPFVLRTVDPPPAAFAGRRLDGARRVGKRIVLDFDDGSRAAIHLMLSGRFGLRAPGSPLRRRSDLAAFDFDRGSLVLTEAGSKHRASIHLYRDEDSLRSASRRGVEVLEATRDEFRDALTRERHTLKRALSDPDVFSGIGNAYSDEILHRARLAPTKLTTSLLEEEVDRLRDAARAVLAEWIERLRREAGEDFPTKVTAFRKGMAVHGRFGEPCPACGSPVQRIVSGDREANYCAKCQTGGRVLADRALSKLLRDDWPRTLEEWERIGRPPPRKG